MKPVYTLAAAAAAFTTLCNAAPFSIGQETIHTAGGSIPTTPFPKTLSPTATSGFQLAHFLKNLEADFFRAGLANITAGQTSTAWRTTSNTTVTSSSPLSLHTTVAKIAAQELIHTATISHLLQTAHQHPVAPCRYHFPVTNLRQFLALSDAITTVSTGAINGLAQSIAVSSDPSLVALTSGMLGVEAWHSAYFRIVADADTAAVSTPNLFETPISGIWAFNLAVDFVVPGSCTLPPVPILPHLEVGVAVESTAQFFWDPEQMPVATAVAQKQRLYIAWVNQLNKPIYTSLNITAPGVGVAVVPAGLAGQVYAAMTATTVPGDVYALADATLAGPAIFVS